MWPRNRIWPVLTFIVLGYFYNNARADETLYLEIIINGRNTNHIAQIIHKENDWEILPNDLSALGLKLDITTKEPILLRSLNITEVTYDTELQRLLITVPNNLLPVQYFNANSPTYSSAEPRRDTGASINYNLVAISGNMDANMTSIWHELHYFNNDFYAVSSGLLQSNSDRYSTSGYTRFETYYQKDNESDMQGITVGDVINATPTWGRSIRMGGIRIARDYELNPELITYPLPAFYGESALPGSVELIINNQMRWRDQVTSGPFLINMVPYISGAGVAQVVTTSPQGQQVQQSVNFYVASQLLAPDMFDYDITMGFRRKNFGLESNSYANNPVISSSLRYGVNKYLTPQLLFQMGDGLQLGGAGLTFLAGNAGVIDIAGTSSRYLNSKGVTETGEQASINYDYTYKKIGVNASYLHRFGNYRDLGTQDEGTLNSGLNKTQTQISLSFNDEKYGGFNLGYFKIENQRREENSFVNFSWSHYFAKSITAFLNITHTLFEQHENSISFTMSIPLGARGQVSNTTQRDSKGEMHTQVQAMSNAPYSGGFGWGASMEDSSEKNRYLQADWRSKYFNSSASAYHFGDQTQYTAALDGALIIMGGDVYATHFVNDAFAIVDADEENVPVMFGHQLVGKTDAHGKILVPDLNSYLENRLSIDPQQLPANAIIDSIEQLVVPRRHGGIHVEFPIRYSQSALAQVVTRDMQPIPAGAILMDRDSEKNYITGWDGEVYLENLEVPLVLFWADGECFVTLEPVADKTLTLPRIGPFICEPAGERK